MDTITESRRREALDTLENLARHLKALNADIVFEALKRGGFNEYELVRLTGALIRTASARRWIVRTGYSIQSQKNHSNLLNVWASRIFGRARDGGAIADAAIQDEFNTWRDAGVQEIHELAAKWEWIEQARRAVPDPKSYRGLRLPEKAHDGAEVLA